MKEDIMPVSKRVSSIKPSPTLAMNAKAVAMRQAGTNLIPCGMGLDSHHQLAAGMACT